MYLELANSEVRAMESHSNFQMFLDETIESAMESTGSFKESMVKIKDRIVKFFKMIFGAIQRFFTRLFGKGERLGHKDAIRNIVHMTKGIIYPEISRLDQLSIIISRFSKPTLSVAEAENIKEEIAHRMDLFKIGTENTLELLKNKVHNTLTTKKDKHEYALIDKYSLSVINDSAKLCETHVLKLQSNLNEIYDSLPKEYLYLINQTLSSVLSTVSKVESTIMQLAQSAMWDSRVEDNETKLKNPITIEVED